MPSDSDQGKKDQVIDFEKIELQTQLNDLKGMLNVLLDQPKTQPQPEQLPKDAKRIIRRETSEQRVERETDTSTVFRSQRGEIKWRRLSTGYLNAAVAMAEETGDFQDMVTLDVVSIGSTQNNMIQLAEKMGKKPWEQRLQKLITPIVAIVAATILGVSFFDSSAFGIVASSLGNPRNEVIVLGLIFLGVGILVYERVSKQRAAKKATTQ